MLSKSGKSLSTSILVAASKTGRWGPHSNSSDKETEASHPKGEPRPGD